MWPLFFVLKDPPCFRPQRIFSLSRGRLLPLPAPRPLYPSPPLVRRPGAARLPPPDPSSCHFQIEKRRRRHRRLRIRWTRRCHRRRRRRIPRCRRPRPRPRPRDVSTLLPPSGETSIKEGMLAASTPSHRRSPVSVASRSDFNTKLKKSYHHSLVASPSVEAVFFSRGKRRIYEIRSFDPFLLLLPHDR